MIENREKIEWFNSWIEDANANRKRILLIGDSVTRELRKKMNMFLKGTYSVDLLAMSYSVLDKMAYGEIRHFFEVTDYTYDYIFFHLGGHHGYNVMCIYSDTNCRSYEKNIEKILKLLRNESRNVITLSITEENLSVETSKVFNKEITLRNKIRKSISDELGISYFDLNQRLDYSRVFYSDWFHFSEDGYEYLSKIIISEYFPSVYCADSKRVFTVGEFNNKISQNKGKKWYIYGNSIRAGLLKEYFDKHNDISFGGIIVSEQYYEKDKGILLLEQVKKEESFIIVTPIDNTIWEMLLQKKYSYLSLSEKVLRELK